MSLATLPAPLMGPATSPRRRRPAAAAPQQPPKPSPRRTRKGADPVQARRDRLQSSLLDLVADAIHGALAKIDNSAELLARIRSISLAAVPA